MESTPPRRSLTEQPRFNDAGLFTLSAVVVLAIPTWTLIVRRLHDVGYSGWWSLVQLVPCGFIVIFVWVVQHGSPESNRWGPPVAANETGT